MLNLFGSNYTCGMVNRENLNILKFIIMKKNMGNADRIIRIIIAFIIGGLYWKGVISGTLGAVFIVLAGVFVLTSLVSFCPLYTIFGLKTCKVKEA